MKIKFIVTVSHRHFYYVILFFFTVLSCTSPTANNNSDSANAVVKPTKPAIIKKPASSFNDTIVINTLAAVFYNPDSAQLEKIKAVNKKEIFEMLTHDCRFQMQNARKALIAHWPQIKIYDANKTRYLLFIKEDGSKASIDLNDKNDICGLFLFDRKKNPALADMPNIETVLNLYFKH